MRVKKIVMLFQQGVFVSIIFFLLAFSTEICFANSPDAVDRCTFLSISPVFEPPFDQIKKIQSLGGSPATYLVKLKSSSDMYVVRHDSRAGNALLEVFNSHIAKDLGFNVPQVQPLSTRASVAFDNAFDVKGGLKAMRPELWEIETEGAVFTVADFLHHKQGFKYLKGDDNQSYERWVQGKNHKKTKIKKKLAVELANMWALYTVLGLPDPHSGNWLLSQNKDLYLIDLAFYFTPSFKKSGSSRTRPELVADKGLHPILLDTDSMMNPFSRKRSSAIIKKPKEIRNLLSLVSSEFKENLSMLTKKYLKKMASDSGNEISQSQIKHILRRASFIANY